MNQFRPSRPDIAISPARWYANATLVASQPWQCNGTLLSCVRTWDRMPAKLRAVSYIVLIDHDNSERILQPKELELYLRDPKFLSL